MSAFVTRWSRIALVGLLVLASFAGGFGLRTLRAEGERFEMRPGELAGGAESVQDGPLTYRVLGWRCGLVAVMGDHGDFLADGQYCRVRLRVTSEGLYVTRYDAFEQRLIDAAGKRYPPEGDALRISDQPVSFDVARNAAYEFDVWFDVPKDADIEAMLVHTPEGGVRPRTAVPTNPGARLELPS